MSTQLKQRIVGIGVLIFLALILLPWLFSGKPASFEKNNHQKKQVLAEDLPEVVKPVAPVTSPIPDELPSSANKEEEKISEPAPADLATSLEQAQNNIVHSQTKKEEISLPEAKIEQGTSTTKKHNPKKAKNIVGQDWTIQLGSFSNKQNAEKLIHGLKSSGYHATSKTSKNTKGESVTRVFVSSQGQHQSAEAAVKNIDKIFKVHGVIVKSKI